MSKKKTTANKKTAASKQTQKKKNVPLILAAAANLCVVVIVLALPKNNTPKNIAADTGNTQTSAPANTETDNVETKNTDAAAEDEVQIIEAGGSLVIPISEISDTVQFYPVEVDGTRMEILAVKDSDGNIRTAFNTCQICYGSGRGYYVQDGNYLVCQNCKNRFTVDQVEIESGGCNPWPIFSDDKTVTEDSIEISYDFLTESKEIFANWKSDY